MKKPTIIFLVIIFLFTLLRLIFQNSTLFNTAYAVRFVHPNFVNSETSYTPETLYIICRVAFLVFSAV